MEAPQAGLSDFQVVVLHGHERGQSSPKEAKILKVFLRNEQTPLWDKKKYLIPVPL